MLVPLATAPTAASVVGGLRSLDEPAGGAIPPSAAVADALTFTSFVVPDGYSLWNDNVSKDGAVALLRQDGKLFTLDVATGALSAVGLQVDGTHPSFTVAVLSGDGSTVVFTENRNRKLSVYDVSSGETTVLSDGPVTALTNSISDDGRYVITNLASSISRIDTSDGSEVPGVFDPATGAALVAGGPSGFISPDGRFFVATLNDVPEIDPTDTNGYRDAYSFDLEGGTVTRLVPPGGHDGRVDFRTFGSELSSSVALMELVEDGNSVPTRRLIWDFASGAVEEISAPLQRPTNTKIVGTHLVVDAQVWRQQRGEATSSSADYSNEQRGLRVWNRDRNVSEFHALRAATIIRLLPDGRLLASISDPRHNGGRSDLVFIEGALGGVASQVRGGPVVSPVFDRSPDAGGAYTAPVTVSWSVSDPAVNPPPSIVVSTEGLRQTVTSDTVCDSENRCAFGSTLVDLLVSPTETYETDSTVFYVTGDQAPGSRRTSNVRSVGGSDADGALVARDIPSTTPSFTPDGAALVAGFRGFVPSSSNQRLSFGNCSSSRPAASWDSTRLFCQRSNSIGIIYDLSSPESGVAPVLDQSNGDYAVDLPRYSVWLQDDVVVGFQQVSASQTDGSCDFSSVELRRTSVRSLAEVEVLSLFCDDSVLSIDYDNDQDLILFLFRNQDASYRIGVVASDGSGVQTIATGDDLGGVSFMGRAVWQDNGNILATVNRGGIGSLVSIDPATGEYNDVVSDFENPSTEVFSYVVGVVGGTSTSRVPTALTTPALKTIRTGIEFEQQLYATGGSGPWTFEVTEGALPSGIALDSATGVLSGFAAEVLTGDVTVTMTDTLGESASRTFTLDVTQVNSLPVFDGFGPFEVRPGETQTLGALAADADGDSLTYEWDIGEDGSVDGTGSTFEFSAEGLSVGDTVVVSVVACDPFGACSKATSELTVVSPVSIVTGSNLPEGRVGEAYIAQLAATGGTEPYTWTVDGGQLPAGLTLDSASGVISGTPTTAGAFTFGVTVTDANGATASGGFAAAPAPSEGSAGQSYSQPISITPPSEPSGQTPLCESYALAAGSDPLPDGVDLDPSTGTLSGTPTVGGSYTVLIDCLYTSAGLADSVSAEFTIVIAADTTSPTVTGVPDRDPDVGVWYNQPVTITWEVEDDSGVATVPDPTLVDENGADQLVVSAESCDPTANCATGEILVSVDSFSPSVDATPDVEPNAAGWWNRPVTFSFVCDDQTSGVATCPDPVEFAADGEGQQVDVEGVDVAGNTSSVVLVVDLDQVAPTIELLAPDEGSSVLEADFVAPSCNASDELSGLDGECTLMIETEASPGAIGYTVRASASDVAENKTIIERRFTVIVDADAPVIVATPDRPANADGWWSGPVTFSFDCVDEESGVAQCPEPVLIATDGAAQSFVVTATDNAGNVGELTVAGINIDSVAPTLQFNGQVSTYELTDVIEIDCAVNDGLSGIAPGATCPTVSVVAIDYAGTTGTFTLEASASDLAGNTASETVEFSVVATTSSLAELTEDYAEGGNGLNGILNHLDQGDIDAYVAQIEAKCCLPANGRGKLFTRAEADALIALALEL